MEVLSCAISPAPSIRSILKRRESKPIFPRSFSSFHNGQWLQFQISSLPFFFFTHLSLLHAWTEHLHDIVHQKLFNDNYYLIRFFKTISVSDDNLQLHSFILCSLCLTFSLSLFWYLCRVFFSFFNAKIISAVKGYVPIFNGVCKFGFHILQGRLVRNYFYHVVYFLHQICFDITSNHCMAFRSIYFIKNCNIFHYFALVCEEENNLICSCGAPFLSKNLFISNKWFLAMSRRVCPLLLASQKISFLVSSFPNQTKKFFLINGYHLMLYEKHVKHFPHNIYYLQKKKKKR